MPGRATDPSRFPPVPTRLRTYVLIGLAGALWYWVFDAAVMAFWFEEGTWWEQIVRPGGDDLWMRSFTGAVFVGASTLTGHLLLRALRTEAELRRSEERFRALVEHAPEAIVVLDCDSMRFVDANPEAVALFGLPRGRLLELGPVELSAPTTPEGEPSGSTARRRIQEALEGGTAVFEWLHVDADGELIPCEVRLLRMPSTEGRLVRGSILDIRDRVHARAERERLQENLLQARKLEAIGRLSGGMAHEFNNFLTIILGNAAMLLRLPGLEDRARELTERIESAGRRASSVTRQLLAVSRRQVLETRCLDLRETLRTMHGVLAPLLGERVELAIVEGDAPASVVADPAQLEQVVLNLVLNARDALPDGGTITVEARRVVLGRGRSGPVEGTPQGVRGPHVMLRVEDTGDGIPPELRERIFEPFFTTKEPGQGTGLGLATVQGIVGQSGGHLTVRSGEGGGACFRIFLPCAPPAAGTEVTAPDSDTGLDSPLRGLRVLVVEDDGAVRRILCETLTDAGCEVFDAPDGATALRRAAELERERAASDSPGEAALDAVLSDVVMPGLSGPEMVERLGAERPAPPVLFVTGYAEEAGLDAVLARDDTALLRKPFTGQELCAALTDLLVGTGRLEARRPVPGQASLK